VVIALLCLLIRHYSRKAFALFQPSDPISRFASPIVAAFKQGMREGS